VVVGTTGGVVPAGPALALMDTLIVAAHGNWLCDERRDGAV
jgi:hypothetical protein